MHHSEPAVSPVDRGYRILLISLFSGCLFAGLLGCIFHWDLYESERENRRLASFPRLRETALDQWPSAFEAYFNDHFGFRNTFIHRYRKIMRSSGVSDYRVIYGQDDWLFLNEDTIMQDFIGTRTPDDQLIARQIRRLEERRKWLAAREIPYLFFIAPNKATVYPDRLPADMSRLKSGQTNRMRFMQQLPEELVQVVIDLTPTLQAAAVDKTVFLLNDTHWNPEGAYLAYIQIIMHVNDRLPGDFTPIASNLLVRARAPFTGDLANMTVSPERYTKEIELLTYAERDLWSTNQVTDPEFLTPEHIPIDNRPPRIIHNPAGHGTAVILHDSFGLRLMEFLPGNFENTVFIWRYSNRTLLPLVVDRFHPDIVIEECVERHLIDRKNGALLDDLDTERSGDGL